MLLYGDCIIPSHLRLHRLLLSGSGLGSPEGREEAGCLLRELPEPGLEQLPPPLQSSGWRAAGKGGEASEGPEEWAFTHCQAPSPQHRGADMTASH